MYICVFCLAILLIFCRFSSTQTSCPAPSRVENFNLTAYASGTWYEIGRAYNNWESRGDCVHVVHEKRSDNVINFTLSTILNHKLHAVQGIIELDADAKGTGLIDYYSSAYKDSEGVTKVPVDILDIDYDKFVLIYHCHYANVEKKLHSYIWILSRLTTLDEDSKKKILSVIKKFQVIDINKVTWDHFSKEQCKINKS